jgi:choline kinase
LIGVETFDELIQAPHYPNPVLIMAGGLGERLGALTRERPKPMLNVGGRPLLETIIRNVVQQGFRNIFISVNYMADMIVEHFGDGSAFGATVQYVRDRTPGTAGALGLLPQFPELPIVVTNGDILTTINYGALLDFHNGTAAEATMAVREHKVHVPYGVVTANDGYLQAIREKPTESWHVSAGIYVVGPPYSITSSAAFASTCRRCWSASSPTRAAWRSIRSGSTGSISAGWRILSRRTRNSKRSSREPHQCRCHRPRFDRATACARAEANSATGVTTVSRRGDGDHTHPLPARSPLPVRNMLLSPPKHRSMPNRFGTRRS